MLRFTSRIKIKQASVSVIKPPFTALSHETELSLSGRGTSEDQLTLHMTTERWLHNCVEKSPAGVSFTM